MDLGAEVAALTAAVGMTYIMTILCRLESTRGPGALMLCLVTC